MPDPVIVLIEDDPKIRGFRRIAFVNNGYRLFEAATGSDGLVQAAAPSPTRGVVHRISTSLASHRAASG